MSDGPVTLSLVQCRCPARHVIMAGLFEADVRAADGEASLRESVAVGIARGIINAWCIVCRAPQESWTYEAGQVRGASKEAIVAACRALEAEQTKGLSLSAEELEKIHLALERVSRN